jgi:hypothetical protein
MLTTISRSYATLDEAKHVIADLEQIGFRPDQLSLIGRRMPDLEGEEGAALAGAGGAARGLLAGMGMLTVPGLGPFVSVGWLASNLVGGSAGPLAASLTGAFTGQFASCEAAERPAALLKRGRSLVSVRGDEAEVQRARVIMDRGAPLAP